MINSTINTTELYQIIRSEHGDPHHILGVHEEKFKGKNVISVRAFIPPAVEVYVLDCGDEDFCVKMEKIHEDGFFEAIIADKKWFRAKYRVVGSSGAQWSFIDPYTFMPVISELDRHLFNQGTHYEVFNKMGSHCMEVDGVKGCLFAVWAPNARRVSVIGDFNSWDGRRNPMRILGDSGIWELFVPGVGEYEKYKFEVKTHDNHLLQKADPYRNYSEMRPNTASVVYDINKYTWNDGDYMESRRKKDVLSAPINIYEVHLGSWARMVEEGNRPLTYREMAVRLIKYVKDMGYTHIQLLPVEEHPFDGSWGYQVTGYYAPTSRYGEPCDFMYLVDMCHQNGIGVFLDWVPAHFPKDDHGLGRFDGTALYEHNDPRLGEHPDWGTYIFNYGRNEVRIFLIGSAIYWLEKYHLDGLRVDAVASMLYLDYGKDEGNWIPNQYGGRENIEAVDFLKHMNSVICGRSPDILIIAEESTAWGNVSRPVEVGGLGFNLKWNMGWMNDFLRYIEKDPIYRKYHHNDLTFGMVYAYTENFVLVLSHDEVVHGKGSMINKMPGDLWQKFANLRCAYGFMYSHPGKKLLFMGGEFGQFDEWSEERSLDWNLLDYDHHAKMQQYSKALNRFYTENRELWQYDFDDRGFEWIDCTDYNASTVSFIRKSDTDHLVVICNFTPTPQFMFRMGVPEDVKYEEVFNSDDLKFGGSGVCNDGVLMPDPIEWNGRRSSLAIKVPPLGVAIFKPVRLC